MKPQSIILRGARVIDPANSTDAIRDVYITDGRITDHPHPDAQVIDLTGKLICPGFIDLHVHLREPGQTHKEDITTGTRAAAAGGFTTIVAMPNTTPPVDTPERLQEMHQRLTDKATVRVLQTACLTKERSGGDLTDAKALARAGAIALTDDGGCIPDAGRMLEAVKRGHDAGFVIVDHCEDTSISQGAPMHAGAIAEKLGIRGQSPLAEEIMVARDALIAAETGAHIHVQHISSKGSVEIIRQARRQHIKISAEATPHHLCLTDECCASHGTNAKMNPPLRTEDDRQALIQGLLDGTIDAIATDHAPHSADEKAASMEDAPFGIIGLQAAVPLTLDRLVHNGPLTLTDWVSCFTAGPRRILGLDAGTLSVGMPADITIIDPDAEHTIDVTAFLSKSHNCPYDGITCRGKVHAIILAGRLKSRSSEFRVLSSGKGGEF